jgi:hypothetical protein
LIDEDCDTLLPSTAENDATVPEDAAVGVDEISRDEAGLSHEYDGSSQEDVAVDQVCDETPQDNAEDLLAPLDDNVNDSLPCDDDRLLDEDGDARLLFPAVMV